MIGGNGNPIDLWWSGKHRHHGGNLQIITAPDGRPIWSSDVRPGREHDITALRTHPGLRQASRGWVRHDLPVLTALGYEDESRPVTEAIKKPAGGQLTEEQKTANKVHNSKPAMNAETPCSKPHARPCGEFPCVPGESARSTPPRWSYYTSSTTGPHEHTTHHSPGKTQ
ncbi:transposase family protein [Nocardia gipuzkoensis]|uniref:transposase family protein n=1 Tax=Nocardia gipuzkoensis TaxID=2749991 RepID=UPI003B8A89BE